MTAGAFDRLRAAAGAAWTNYVDHPFVRGMADGALPMACFRRYLVQDYLFLIHFARAYALAAFKADDPADIRQAANGLAAIIDVEMGLHVAYCAGFGIDEAAMAATAEESATLAYTRFVLERGAAGDLLDLHVALAPCMCGYAEIGRRLAADPATRRDGNPYWTWIETYAADDFQRAAAAEAALVDRLFVGRGGEARWESLARTFSIACRLEADFWSMGLAAEM